MWILIQWRKVFNVNFVTTKFGRMGINKYCTKTNPSWGSIIMTWIKTLEVSMSIYIIDYTWKQTFH